MTTGCSGAIDERIFGMRGGGMRGGGMRGDVYARFSRFFSDFLKRKFCFKLYFISEMYKLSWQRKNLLAF